MTSKTTVALPTPGQDRIRAYARASGDMNPLHLDSEAARQAGFEDVIAHGMLVMGLALSVLRASTGTDAIRTSRVRFQAPVTAGEALTLTYALNNQDADFTVTGGDGSIKISGTATLS